MKDKDFTKNLLTKREELTALIKEAESNLRNLNQRLKSIDNLISLFSGDTDFLPKDYIPPIEHLYPKDGTWKAKVLYVLENSDRPLSAKEICKLITKQGIDTDEETTYKTVTQMLWNLKGIGKVKHEGKLYSIIKP